MPAHELTTDNRPPFYCNDGGHRIYFFFWLLHSLFVAVAVAVIVVVVLLLAVLCSLNALLTFLTSVFYYGIGCDGPGGPFEVIVVGLVTILQEFWGMLGWMRIEGVLVGFILVYSGRILWRKMAAVGDSRPRSQSNDKRLVSAPD